MHAVRLTLFWKGFTSAQLKFLLGTGKQEPPWGRQNLLHTGLQGWGGERHDSGS